MTSTTEERVRGVLERVLQIPATAAVASTPLDAIAPIDSLSLAELAAALDEEFAIEVPAEGLRTDLSVPELVALVDEVLRS